MPYIKRMFICNRIIEIEKKFSCKYHSKRASRAPKCNNSIEAVIKNNERQSANTLRRLINTNFVKNDYSMVLTYAKDQRPANGQVAAKNLANFWKRLKRSCQKIGAEFKYIATTEVGKTGNVLHHHIIISRIPAELITKAWQFGHVKFSLLDATGQYQQLAAYIIKETKNVFRDKSLRASGKRWNASKNLERPKIVTEVIQADSWREEPRPLKGYVITDLFTGVSDFTGYAYQTYTMERIATPGFEDFEELKRTVAKSAPAPVRPHKRKHNKKPEPAGQISLWPTWLV